MHTPFHQLSELFTQLGLPSDPAAIAQGVATLGPLGTFAVFVAMVSAVSGASLFSLGASFNYLVSLFYRRTIRQGLFKKPFFEVPLERHFWAFGAAAIGVGVVMALVSLGLSFQGWAIERLWLYLSASALFILVGLQLAVVRARRVRPAGGRE